VKRWLASLGALCSLCCTQLAQAQQAQMDPNNPTCPLSPNWSTYPQMRFSERQVNGQTVLLAEGQIDDNLIPRLQEALQHFQGQEIWLRSPGGNARVGNQAGMIIRQNHLFTRIPAGWACFSACNFLFMGGEARFIDPGGQFIVHMFTHTSDRATIRQEIARGEDNAIGMIGDIEQDSALLASEDNDFLIRMGVSRLLLTEVMYRQNAVADGTNHSTRRCLTQDEVHRYNVVNG
jgi:hypothetical protein